MNIDNQMDGIVIDMDIDAQNGNKFASSTGTADGGYEYENKVEDIATIPKNIVDIDKLTTLLEGSTKNDHLIASKHVMALIGLTGT